MCILITSHISSKVKSSEDYSHEVSWYDQRKTARVALMQHHPEDVDVTLECYPPAHHTVTRSGLSSGHLQDTDLK